MRGCRNPRAQKCGGRGILFFKLCNSLGAGTFAKCLPGRRKIVFSPQRRAWQGNSGPRTHNGRFFTISHKIQLGRVCFWTWRSTALEFFYAALAWQGFRFLVAIFAFRGGPPGWSGGRGGPGLRAFCMNDRDMGAKASHDLARLHSCQGAMPLLDLCGSSCRAKGHATSRFVRVIFFAPGANPLLDLCMSSFRARGQSTSRFVRGILCTWGHVTSRFVRAE